MRKVSRLKSVLITRPTLQAATLLTMLDKHGLTYHHIPAVDIHYYSLNSAQLACLQQADIIIVISVNAVIDCVTSATIVAVGNVTQHALEARGYEHVMCPAVSSSEGLLEMPLLQAVKGKRIVLLCGVGGRQVLEATLQSRGAICERLEVYERIYPANREVKLQALLASESIACVVVTSGEILQNLSKMAGQHRHHLQCLPLVAISQRIASIAKGLGFDDVAVVENTDLAVVDYLMKMRE